MYHGLNPWSICEFLTRPIEEWARAPPGNCEDKVVEPRAKRQGVLLARGRLDAPVQTAMVVEPVVPDADDLCSPASTSVRNLQCAILPGLPGLSAQCHRLDSQRRIREVAMKARQGSRMTSNVQVPYRDQGVGCPRGAGRATSRMPL